MHEVPSLPYKYSDLEPYIDEETMRIHHTKHHQAYVDKLNAALERYPDLQRKSIHDLMADLSAIPEEIRPVVQNNGGGHLNHLMFWEMVGPAGTSPHEQTISLIDAAFGSLDNFKAKFKEAALGRFGSGWAWLVLTPERTLQIITTQNQDTPWSEGKRPVLGIDVWEHAYYLKYQNRRADYIEAFWNVVNWSTVEKNIASER